LKRLIVAKNKINDTSSFKKHSSLEFIDLSFNNLTNLKGLGGHPALLEIKADNNKIAHFNDLTNL
jgi:Leucine-rich repeat (LRR) protein